MNDVFCFSQPHASDASLQSPECEGKGAATQPTAAEQAPVVLSLREGLSTWTVPHAYTHAQVTARHCGPASESLPRLS